MNNNIHVLVIVVQSFTFGIHLLHGISIAETQITPQMPDTGEFIQQYYIATLSAATRWQT